MPQKPPAKKTAPRTKKNVKALPKAGSKAAIKAGGKPATTQTPLSVCLEFPNNKHFQELCGHHDAHLGILEEKLGVQIVSRGNRLTIFGQREEAEMVQRLLEDLYDFLGRGHSVGIAEVEAALRLVLERQESEDERLQKLSEMVSDEVAIHTPLARIAPRSPRQRAYIDAIHKHELTFGVGPAGTGKTWLAVAAGVHALVSKKVRKLILTRPVVEAGENLGFLPGTFQEKLDPYLRPLFDALHDMLGPEKTRFLLEQGIIEMAPLAYMRGRTLSHAFVILDEAQNTTPSQMKMFLTRLGEGSRMIVTGDPTQTDLKPGQASGLKDALSILDGVQGIALVRFTEVDVVRHALVSRIVRAYEEKH